AAPTAPVTAPPSAPPAGRLETGGGLIRARADVPERRRGRARNRGLKKEGRSPAAIAPPTRKTPPQPRHRAGIDLVTRSSLPPASSAVRPAPTEVAAPPPPYARAGCESPSPPRPPEE